MSKIEVNLDAFVLPDGHRCFKLFPGNAYKLNKEIVRAKAAILDIYGLDSLPHDPALWTDAALRKIIADDRIRREIAGQKVVKRPASQDTKRLKFLKNLIFEAKKGDLVVVPLGKGLDGEVAIGEFADDPGVVTKVTLPFESGELTTWGRSVKWLDVLQRKVFTLDLNSRLHAPTAFHIIESSFKEEIYLAAYKSFTYDDIYVASFPSKKEKFTTTDQALIGLWFNGISVIHQYGTGGAAIPDGKDFYELGLEEIGVDLDLVRNSPISVILRTIGPLAFSALALYPLAAEGATLTDLKDITITTKHVAGATKNCEVIVPADLQRIVKGLGHGRWDHSCRVGKRIDEGATVKPTASLKNHQKKTR